jgi:hypothetical protein
VEELVDGEADGGWTTSGACHFSDSPGWRWGDRVAGVSLKVFLYVLRTVGESVARGRPNAVVDFWAKGDGSDVVCSERRGRFAGAGAGARRDMLMSGGAVESSDGETVGRFCHEGLEWKGRAIILKGGGPTSRPGPAGPPVWELADLDDTRAERFTLQC